MTIKNGMMLWIDAYMADTGHLTTLEHGAYFLILIAMWRTPHGWLPNDKSLLRKCAKLSAANWQRVEGTIMPLLLIEDDRVSQKRLLRERRIAHTKTTAATTAANTRWASKSLEINGADHAVASNPHMQMDAFAYPPNPNPTKKESKIEGPHAKRRANRSTISDDWTPDEKGIAYATERGFDSAKINQLVRACRDYHIKHGTLIAGERGLAATWRTWCENEIKFSANRRAQSEKPQPHWMQQRDETAMYLKQMRERAKNGTAQTDRTAISGPSVSFIDSDFHTRTVAEPDDQ